MKRYSVFLLSLFIFNQNIVAQLVCSNTYSPVNNGYKKHLSVVDTGSQKTSPLLLSILIPGLGDYSLRNKNEYSVLRKAFPWLIASSVYGFLGGGIFLKTQSDKNYKLYHETTDQSVMDAKYSLANNQNKNSYILLSTGFAIWVTDIVWVAIKNRNRKKLDSAESSNLYFLFDSKNQAMTFSLKIKI